MFKGNCFSLKFGPLATEITSVPKTERDRAKSNQNLRKIISILSYNSVLLYAILER